MDVCPLCYVLSGRGLIEEPITRPEESYRLWCVVVCDLETSRMRRPWPALGRSATKKKNLIVIICNELCFWWDFLDFVNRLVFSISKEKTSKSRDAPRQYVNISDCWTYVILWCLFFPWTIRLMTVRELGEEIIITCDLFRYYGSIHYTYRGTRWRSCLRHCATSRKVARLRFPMVSLEFFIDIILPAALWPWGWLSL